MSNSTIDWGALVSQNRAKSIGVMWSEEEYKALKEGVPADYVRKGVLSKKEFDETKESIDIKSKPELLAEARRLGVNASEEAPVEILEKEIEARTKVKPVTKASEDAVKKASKKTTK